MIRLFLYFLTSELRNRLFDNLSSDERLLKRLNKFVGQVGRVKGQGLPVEDVE